MKIKNLTFVLIPILSISLFLFSSCEKEGTTDDYLKVSASNLFNDLESFTIKGIWEAEENIYTQLFYNNSQWSFVKMDKNLNVIYQNDFQGFAPNVLVTGNKVRIHVYLDYKSDLIIEWYDDLNNKTSDYINVGGSTYNFKNPRITKNEQGIYIVSDYYENGKFFIHLLKIDESGNAINENLIGVPETDNQSIINVTSGELGFYSTSVSQSFPYQYSLISFNDALDTNWKNLYSNQEQWYSFINTVPYMDGSVALFEWQNTALLFQQNYLDNGSPSVYAVSRISPSIDRLQVFQDNNNLYNLLSFYYSYPSALTQSKRDGSDLKTIVRDLQIKQATTYLITDESFYFGGHTYIDPAGNPLPKIVKVDR